MEMANNNKQTQLKSTEEPFSWDRAFFTSDGFLGAEELSNMLEGGELEKIEELESMEAKLFKETEAPTKKCNGKRDSQSKKVTGGSGHHKDAPIKTPPKRSSGGSPGTNVKTLARKSISSKTGKDTPDPPLKTPPRIRTKNKVASVNTRVSRTSPASPVSPGSPGSSSSTFSFSPRRSSSATNARRNDDWKASKPAISLMPKTQSSISLKIKPPSSPSGPLNSSSSPTTQRPSESSLSCTTDQRSKSRGIKGSPVHHTSKPALKNHPTGQTNRKQPPKTAAAANTEIKPNSPKTKKQSSPKAKASSENIFIISPELLDLKGKINALKMEIDMHKKDRCNKMARAESDQGIPFAIK